MLFRAEASTKVRAHHRKTLRRTIFTAVLGNHLGICLLRLYSMHAMYFVPKPIPFLTEGALTTGGKQSYCRSCSRSLSLPHAQATPKFRRPTHNKTERNARHDRKNIQVVDSDYFYFFYRTENWFLKSEPSPKEEQPSSTLCYCAPPIVPYRSHHQQPLTWLPRTQGSAINTKYTALLTYASAVLISKRAANAGLLSTSRRRGH